jgi:hypothetical protein
MTMSDEAPHRMTLADFYRLCHESRGLPREAVDEAQELEVSSDASPAPSGS